MKVEIKEIGLIDFTPENDSDKAILQNMVDKYLLVFDGGNAELQTLEEIQKIDKENRGK